MTQYNSPNQFLWPRLSAVRSNRKRISTQRLLCELLEDRVTPATLNVTSFADNLIANDGLLTLREAVIADGSSEKPCERGQYKRAKPTTFSGDVVQKLLFLNG